MKARVAALIALGCLACAACASPGASPFDAGVAPGTIHVEVDNQNFYQATVYVVSSAGERRLGSLSGVSQKTFVARLVVPGDVRLRVRMLAGETFTTEPLQTGPGETLLLIIPTSLRPRGGR